jgi:hypothetical protein
MFVTHFGNKSQHCWRGNYMSLVIMSPAYPVHACLMAWQWLSLSASLIQKISAAMYHVCQITLNRYLFCKFEKRYKFSSCVEAKLHTRPACNFFSFSFQYKYILWACYRRTTELQWKYILYNEILLKTNSDRKLIAEVFFILHSLCCW